MLTKLLKYDLKDIYKILIIFYSLAIFFATLTRIFFNIENSLVMNIIGKVCSGVTISMLFNILINNVMRLWARFKSNFYGDEAYLTHTLPVKKSTLYISKILAALFSLFTTVAVAVLALFIAYYSKENMQVIKALLESAGQSFDLSPALFLLIIAFVLFLEFLSAVQCGFSGIILGHKMYRGKIGFSVLYGFIVYSITQVFAVLTVFVAGLFNDDMMLLFTSNQLNSLSVLKTAMTVAIVTYFAISVIVYFVNQKLFNKGVNVE